MKQLKVMVPSYSTTNGIFRASFKDSFTIEPESRIMMDKISFTIAGGNVTNISIPSQTILINNIANEVGSVNREAFVPGAIYNTVNDLMDALNVAYASTLESSPVFKTGHIIPSDVGLAYYNEALGTASPYSYKFSFDQVQLEADVGADTDMTPIIANTYLAPTTFDTPYFYVSQYPILRGGLSCSTTLYQFQVGSVNGFFEMGLYNSTTPGDTLKYGIHWEGATNTMSYVNNGNYTTIPNPEIFDNIANDPGIRLYFYIRQGQLRFGLFNMSDADPDQWETLYETPLGAFLGYNVNNPYFYQINGIKSANTLDLAFGVPLLTLDPVTKTNNKGYYTDTSSIGTIYYLPKAIENLPISAGWFPEPDDNIFTRSVRLDFTNALTLLNGLGLLTPIQQTTANYNGSILGTVGGIGFVNTQELELDIFELPLDSYMSNENFSKDSQGNISYFSSGRVNCLSFFTPQLLNPVSQGSSQYYYENKNMPFIGINNPMPMVLETLSFRLWSPVTPTSTINFTNISFNMYIQSPKDGLPIAFA